MSVLMRSMLLAKILLLSGCHAAGSHSVVDARSAAGLAYDIAGHGPTVVLIHGTNLDRRMWDDEFAWLQEHVRVLRYDLRGQGASEFPDQEYSNHADLLTLLDELDEHEVTLVGLSAGAQVALDVAYQAPDRVRQMVLVSPSLSGYVPESMPPFLGDLMMALQAGDYSRANDVMLASPIMAVPPLRADAVRRMVHDNSRLWTIPFSLVQPVSPPVIQHLHRVETPTLVLVGDEDLEAIRVQGALLKDQLPRVRYNTIPGGGHLLNMTSPKEFRDAVSAFLGMPSS